MPRPPLAVAGVLALLFAARGVQAEIAPARIAYHAPPSCPGEDAFLAAVHADASDARAPAEGEAARALDVAVVEEDGVLRGRLRIEEIDGSVSVREVTGRTCQEVVSALSLVTALALEGGPPAAPPAPAPSPPDPPAPARPARRPARRPPAPPLPPGPPPRVDPGVVRWEMGVEAIATGAVAPSVAWGAAVFVDRSVWGLSGLTPSLRLGAAIAQSPSTAAAGGTARFTWGALRASGCPAALLWGPLTVRPCAGLDAGILRGEGAGVTAPLHQARGWVAATVLGRLGWTIVPGLVLDAEVGAMLPFVRDTFVFQPQAREIHATPAVGAFGALGLGAAFE